MANKVVVDLLVDSKDALKSINSFASSATKLLLGFGAALGIGVGFKEIIDGAIESEDSIQKLNTALALSGDFSKDASKAFQTLGDELQNTGLFSDEAVLSAASLAKQFNTTNEQAQELVRAAADLSAQTGKDLNDSVRILGQTLDGTGGKINELVPATRALTAEQLRSGDAIQLVAERFKGAADAAGSTFSGALNRAKFAFSDIFEEIGRVIVQNPVVVGLLNQLADVLKRVSQFVKENSSEFSAFITNGILFLARSVPIAISVLETILKPIKFLILGFNSLREIIHGTILELVQGSEFIKTSLGVVIRVLAQVVAGAIGVVQALSEIPAVSGTLKKAGVNVENLSKGFDKVTDAVFDFQDSVSEENLTSGIQSLIDANLESEKVFLDTFATIDSGLASAKSGSEEFAKQIEELGKQGKKLGKQLPNALGDAAKALTPEEIKKNLGEISKTPITLLFNPKLAQGIDELKVTVAGGVGLLNDMLAGAKGAVNLFSAGVGGAVEAFAPGVGAAAGKIIEVLAKGPDEVKKMIDEFIKSIPEIAVNIAKSIGVIASTIVRALPTLVKEIIAAVPEIVRGLVEGAGNFVIALIEEIPNIILAIVEGIPFIIENLIAQLPLIVENFISRLVENLPQIIEALIFGMPRIIDALIANLPRLIAFLITELPKIIQTLQIEIIKNIPNIVRAFGAALIEEGKNFVNSIIEGIKGFFGGGGGLGGAAKIAAGPAGLLGGFLGFANGGEVPGGAPFTDRIPAALTPGENVITNDLSAKLNRVADVLLQGGGAGNQPVVVQAPVNIDGKQFAAIMLDINRRGFRTADA